MPAGKQIDIRQMDWPLGILNCKKELNRMKPGEQLEVLVQDKDEIQSLVALINQLPEHRQKKFQEGRCIRLVITKTAPDRA